jgi:hypothetical protein
MFAGSCALHKYTPKGELYIENLYGWIVQFVTALSSTVVEVFDSGDT